MSSEYNETWKIAGYNYPVQCAIPCIIIQQSTSPSPFVYTKSQIFCEDNEFFSPEEIKRIECGILDIKRGNTISASDVKKMLDIE